METRDRCFVITGAARGIGRAIALDLAANGAKLALIDHDGDALAPTAEACRSAGAAEVLTRSLDVTREEAVDEAMADISAAMGGIDGLINNAGITRDALLLKVRDGQVTDRMSLAQWRAVIDVNLTGVFLCGRAAAEHMVRGGRGGVIVNISSISRAGNAGQSNYSAAKAGVMAMTVTWARELGRYGIRSAAIAPGFVNTDMVAAMRPEVLEKVIAPVPLRRLGEPAEIADAVRFIIGNDFFSGRCIDLDGGLRL